MYIASQLPRFNTGSSSSSGKHKGKKFYIIQWICRWDFGFLTGNILANPLKQAFDIEGNGGVLWKPSQFVSPDRSRQHFKIKVKRAWLSEASQLNCTPPCFVLWDTSTNSKSNLLTANWQVAKNFEGVCKKGRVAVFSIQHDQRAGLKFAS